MRALILLQFFLAYYSQYSQEILWKKPILLVIQFYKESSIIFVINSARHLPSSIFASAQYIQILAGGVLGYLIFKDIPTMNVYIGSILIIGAGLYIILREAKLGVNIVTSTTRHPTIPIKKD